MATRFRRRSDVDSREELQNSLSIGVVPLRPPPEAPTILRNLEEVDSPDESCRGTTETTEISWAWAMGTASLVGVLQADVRCACYIGKVLYTADIHGTVLEWNVQDATNQIFMRALAAPVNVLVSVKKETEMWAGLANGNIASLRLESRSVENQIVHAHDAAVNCIAEGSNCVWSGGDDFLIKKWDLQGIPLFAYNHHHGSIRDLLISRNKPEQTNIQLWSSSNDATISVTSLQDSNTQHELASEVKMLSGHSKAILVLCKVGVDEIWSGCEDGSIGVWSSLTFSFKKQLNLHKGPVVSLVVMGGNVWSGSGDRTVLVWDASICQLLFTLGDHGGYVKAMVRVEYMCWIFASGKNVKIWCAQSVWRTCEQEKDRLNTEMSKLKYELDKCQWEKSSLGATQESSAEKLSNLEREVQRAHKDGAAILAKQTGESEKLKDVQLHRVKELERLVTMTDENKKILTDENKFLIGEIARLKTEKDRAEIDGRTKLQDMERNMMQVQDELRKAQDKFEDISKENKSNESLRISSLGELQKAKEDKQTFMNEVAQLKENARRNKDLADHAAGILKASHEQQLAEMEKRLQDMQNQVGQSHRELSFHLEKKNDESRKLEGEVKKATKDLNRALKSLEDEKTRSAMAVEELRRTIEHMKKNQAAISAAETQNVVKFENLEKALQQARNELQVATDEKSHILAQKNSEMQKLKLKVRDLRKAVKDAEYEKNKLQQSFQEKENVLVGNDNKENQLQNQRDDPSVAIKGLESDSDRLNEFLGSTTSEKDEAGSSVKELKTQLKNLEQDLAQTRAIASEHTLALQNLGAEKDSLSKELKNAIADKIQLEEDLSCLRAESVRAASDQALAMADLKKLHEVDLEKLGGFYKDRDLNTENVISLNDALDHCKKEKSTLEDDLVLATNQLEQVRNEIAIHEQRAAQTTKEFEEMDQRLTQVLYDLDQLRKQNATKVGNSASMAEEINKLSQVNDVQETRLDIALAAAQPQQRKKQDGHIMSSVDDVNQLKKKLLEMEESLEYATREIERLNNEKFLQNSNSARVASEGCVHKKDKSNTGRRPVYEVAQVAQMKRRTSTPDEDSTSTGDEFDQLLVDADLSDVKFVPVPSQLQHLKKENNKSLKYRLAKTAEKLEHLLQENASMQVNSALLSDELDQLQKIKGLLEEFLARDKARETNGLQQLCKENSLLEVNVVQIADRLEKRLSDKEVHNVSAEHMADVNDDLRNEMAMLEDGLAAFQMEHVDIQEKIVRLHSLLEEAQDECRLTKEIACSDAEDAAWRIVELQERVAELEENNSPPTRSVEGAVWERVRELEMALLQAHIDYNSLSQEIKRLRKRKKSKTANVIATGVHKARKTMQTQSHNFSRATPKGVRVPDLEDTVDIALKAAQPGFSMEYTNLKVSGCNDQETKPTKVEVCPEKPNPHTPHVVTPRRITPINIPSPVPELIRPVEVPPPVIEERERYFPSHGALRVRRGLGPVNPIGEYSV